MAEIPRDGVGVVPVWDSTVRVIHWLIVVLVALSWLTAELELLPLHHLSGYLLLALVLTRVVWGFIGSTTARFSHFVKGPSAVLPAAAALFQRGKPAVVGHNPLGALSVVALLALLVLQAALGLFTQDSDGLAPGPLADLFPRAVGRAVAAWHETVFNVLLAFIALHLAAVLFHAGYIGNTLVRPMITGRKSLPADAARHLRFVPGKWAAILFVLIAAAIFSIAAF